jgi:pimeloyl-ACP methyl ester carboxylesterase
VSNVTSADRTVIAFDRSGEGPPIILVAGAFVDRSQLNELAELLAPSFTVLNYDRRGRGESGDTPPYEVQREIEDLEALIEEAGGAACVFGGSSGAALALEAAAAGLEIEKLVVYEPPYVVDDSRPAVGADIAERLRELIADGRRGDAAELFMTEGGLVPSEVVAEMRRSPTWAATEAMAHTLPYDAAIMGRGNRPSTERLAGVTAPTLVIDGGASPAWIRASAETVAEALPNASRTTLPEQMHNVAQEVLAPVVSGFIRDEGLFKSDHSSHTN